MDRTYAKTVLVIDDDPDFRELIKIASEDCGLDCLEAPDCASALSMVEGGEDRVRVVLLDYCMPGLSPSCCAQTLAVRFPEDVPIVLVSAAVDIRERATSIGLKRFLAKPFEMEELLALLS